MLAKKVIIKIGGMHCEHCVSRIKSALEHDSNISSVTVHLEDGTAVLTYKKKIDLEQVQKIIEGEDFIYLGVKE